jgi:hypothetical protein
LSTKLQKTGLYPLETTCHSGAPRSESGIFPYFFSVGAAFTAARKGRVPPRGTPTVRKKKENLNALFSSEAIYWLPCSGTGKKGITPYTTPTFNFNNKKNAQKLILL